MSTAPQAPNLQGRYLPIQPPRDKITPSGSAHDDCHTTWLHLANNLECPEQAFALPPGATRELPPQTARQGRFPQLGLTSLLVQS